jgi:hypothetical protein
MKFKILICGCGKLGSRYLQGLLDFNHESEIYVFDVSNESIKNSQNILDKFPNKYSHKFIFSDNFIDFPKDFDLTILSTTANGRSILINFLNSNFKIKNWLLEKIIAQSSNDLIIIQDILKQNNSIYVNTPRRTWALYIKLKEKLTKNFPKKMNIIGNFGLACNAIHFIDLFAWLTGEVLISINCENLDNFWVESKRKDFWEVSGEIIAEYSKGSILVINSKISNEKFTIKLMDSVEYLIDEDRGNIFENKINIINEKVPLQSELTPIIVDSILTKGICQLPTLTESALLHKPFLEALQSHWNRYNSLEGEILKIT